MVFDNRITNGIENEGNTSAQTSNNISMEAEIIPEVDGSEEINSAEDMKEAFADIRKEGQNAVSAAELTELYRQAGSLIRLLEMSPFKERVGDQLDEIRQVAEDEFAQTARALNSRGEEVGSKSHYAEQWGG